MTDDGDAGERPLPDRVRAYLQREGVDPAVASVPRVAGDPSVDAAPGAVEAVLDALADGTDPGADLDDHRERGEHGAAEDDGASPDRHHESGEGVAPDERTGERAPESDDDGDRRETDRTDAGGEPPSGETGADPTDPTPADDRAELGTGDDGEDDGDGEDVDVEAARAAFADAVEWYHRQVDRRIPDHTDAGEHPDRPTTARDYFQHGRGWAADTVDDRRLGWAPGDHYKDEIIRFLFDRGHDREAILATGLFSDDLRPLWRGRYVLPYFDGDGRPAYAIARATGPEGGGAAGYGGHPADFLPGKYGKVRHTDDRVPLSEPIWGLDTLRRGEPVVVAEGIADAIAAVEAGYAALSPVAKEFKREHIGPLVEAVEAHDVPRVYVVPDAERPSVSAREDRPDDPDRIGDVLSIASLSPGLGGALRTAHHLREHGVESMVAPLPRPGLDKVDLDDYLHGWADDLGAVLASARPPTAFDAYDAATRHLSDDDGRAPTARDGDHPDAADRGGEHDRGDDVDGVDPADPHVSSLWALDMADVTPDGFDSARDRGKNPTAHTGDSEAYFVLQEGRTDGELIALDWKGGAGEKSKARYNALTYLLVAADARDRDAPEGPLSDREVWIAWREARENDVVDLPLAGPDGEALPDPIPRRAMWHLAREHDLAAKADIPEGSDGYDDRLPADAREAVLDVVREDYGLDPHRPVDDDRGAADREDDPTDLAVTLDPSVAHRAASAVTPADLPEDSPDPPLAPTDDRQGWRCPRCGEPVTVVRAAAIDAGAVASCEAPLDGETYTDAYDLARRRYGAPLPEYVDHRTTTDRWATVKGALRQLTPLDLDRDAWQSEVTGTRTTDDGETVLTLDPAWRDSDSGESVVLYEDGTVFDAHPDHHGTVDALRFVALDAGILDWRELQADGYALTGERFRDAYDLARREYDAPLPDWRHGDADHTAVLPDPDALASVGDDVDAETELQAARDGVADLYDDAADRPGVDVLSPLPGLGKTEQVARQATEHPATYAAGRREMMAEMLERAREHGATARLLPTFADRSPSEAVLDAAVGAVREHGQDLLADRERLVETVRERVPDGTPLGPVDGDGEGGADGEGEGEGDDVDLDLDRDSCPVADGEHGVGWFLAAHAARALAFKPAKIHVDDRDLFGDPLPCRCDDDGEPREDDVAACPYSRAWQDCTDPDRPYDLLVGHYTHLYVEGARTVYTRDENGRTEREPRTLVLDEFPGTDAFAAEFGPEYADAAAWLASAVAPDVADPTDLADRRRDLWADDRIRAWLEGERDADALAPHRATADALETAAHAVEAVETAAWVLSEWYGVADDLGIVEDLERVADGLPEWSPTDVGPALARIADAVATVDDDDLPGGVLDRIADLAEAREGVARWGADDWRLDDALAGYVAADHLHGPLAAVVESALETIRDGDPDPGAADRIDTAREAVLGGREGIETLAIASDDGAAHPRAGALLYAVLAPDDADAVATIDTDSYGFDDGSQGEGGTRLKRVSLDRRTVLLDRRRRGALVHAPPTFEAGGGEAPVVGLDATAREQLWALALGVDDAPVRDIHDSDRERAAFLRDVYGLRVVQTSRAINSYEGDPSGKNFDDDVQLVADVDRQHGAPAVMTTKVVENAIGDRLGENAAALEHYGDLKGSERLADHRVAALLGSQHYGDAVVEKYAALAGEDTTRSGHGRRLSYGSAVGDAVLDHMREDPVMQAALRVGRDTGGAVVYAHTAALREDLPVVAEGEVVETFTDTAQAIADVAADFRGRSFSSRDVRRRLTRRDDVDPSARTVRRVLSELAADGYLDVEDPGAGRANEYRTEATPGEEGAEVSLPDVDDPDDRDEPGQATLDRSYTWSVRVTPRDRRVDPPPAPARAVLPPPGADDAPAPAG